MAEFTPEQSQKYNAALQELLSQEKADAYRLPGLVYDETFWDRWMKKLDEWLNPEARLTSSVADFNWAFIFNALKYLLIIGVVIGIGWILYQWIRRRQNEKNLFKKLSPKTGKSLADPDQFLNRQIQKALADKDWSLAGRLRWKLFLKRLRDDEFLTPREYRYRTPAPANESLDIILFDEVMFGKRPVQDGDYQTLDRTLAGMEKGGARAA